MNIRIKQNILLAIVIGLSILTSACSRSPAQEQEVFASPQAAIEALAELIGDYDEQRIDDVFGPDSADLFLSGDPDSDREDYQRVKAMIEEGVAFEDYDDNTLIALLGDDAWPWPIPLVRDGDGWRFDTAEGREELLNRRIGRNELWTLTALHEVVDAQREYRNQFSGSNPPAYAQRFLSSEGNRDGLYWPTTDGMELSPLGELLAGSEALSAEPQPFHGYFYRILTSRGANAPGGELDFFGPNGELTRGFGVIAWPANYSNSGVMTFTISHRGLAYQKDLGADTEQAAAAIQSFDPDTSWVPTEDVL